MNKRIPSFKEVLTFLNQASDAELFIIKDNIENRQMTLKEVVTSEVLADLAEIYSLEEIISLVVNRRNAKNIN